MKELKAARERLSSFESAESQRKESEMSELQKAQAKIKASEDKELALTKRLRDQALQHQFERMAAQLGVVSAEDAFRLADLSSVELDEATGKAEGLEELLDSMKASKPWLFAAAPPAPGRGPTGGNPSKAPATGLNSEAINQMSNQDFLKLMEAVKQGRAVI